jgi:AcrR family transcriptional regulator
MGRKIKLSRDDWIAAAMEWVAAHGVATLAVEPLARSLGVTKGGFYWCFANRDELLQAVLERWEAQGTQNIIHLVEQADLAAQARQLITMVARSVETQAPGHEAPAMVRMQYALWSASNDPLVAPVVERVTATRVHFLARVLEQAGLPPEVAELRATLGYANYVGMVLLRATQGPNDVAGMGREGLTDAYITMLLTPPPGLAAQEPQGASPASAASAPQARRRRAAAG